MQQEAVLKGKFIAIHTYTITKILNKQHNFKSQETSKQNILTPKLAIRRK